MMKHPLLLGLIIYGLVTAGLVTRNGAYLALALPVLLYLAAGLLYRPEKPQLTIERSLNAHRITPDEAVTVTLTITNQGPLLEELYLEDVVPPSLRVIEGTPRRLTPLPPNQPLTLKYTVAGQRGLYRFSEVRLTVQDSLGLFEKTVTASAPAQFFVLPEIIRIKRVAIRPPRTGIYAGPVPARQGGPGVEFFGVREYQPGDPLRWVNTRASARHQEALFVNEFEQERVVDVGLILDARRQSDVRRGRASMFEYSIQATAALADTFLDGGNRVGLFIYGRSLDWTFPGFGKRQRERIVRALARAQQGSGKIFESLEHLPTRLFPVRSQLVLVSPLLPQDVDMLIRLRARRYRLLIISPDPVSFERRGLPDSQTVAQATQIAYIERQFLLTKLRQAEIRVVDWDVSIPFHQIAHAALSRLPFLRGQTLV